MSWVKWRPPVSMIRRRNVEELAAEWIVDAVGRDSAEGEVDTGSDAAVIRLGLRYEASK